MYIYPYSDTIRFQNHIQNFTSSARCMARGQFLSMLNVLGLTWVMDRKSTFTLTFRIGRERPSTRFPQSFRPGKSSRCIWVINTEEQKDKALWNLCNTDETEYECHLSVSKVLRNFNKLIKTMNTLNLTSNNIPRDIKF